MKRAVVAAALSWDGARVPRRRLPRAAREFLGAAKTLPARRLTALFAKNGVKEIRICWVPEMRGGPALAGPFSAPNEKRIAFRAVRTRRFGDVLGVVYRSQTRARAGGYGCAAAEGASGTMLSCGARELHG
jgi:hypothetical protein